VESLHDDGGEEEERAMGEEDLIVEDAARVVLNTVMKAVHLRYIAHFGENVFGRTQVFGCWWFVSVRKSKFTRAPNFDQKKLVCVGGREGNSKLPCICGISEVSHPLEEPNCVESDLNGYPPVSTKNVSRSSHPAWIK
jgi:hypothetical protein